VGGIAVIAIVVVGATGGYLQGRSVAVKSKDLSGLREAAVKDLAVRKEIPSPLPNPGPVLESESLVPDINIPESVITRCFSECELTTRHNALVEEVRNINFTATINALENRIILLENILSNGNFTDQINDLDNRVTGLAGLVNMIQTQIGAFEYTPTINSLWSHIFGLGNALSNHTTAHNDGGYPPIYGVDY
jgi:hypothetical protein